MLKSIWAARWYIVIGLFTFLFTLLVTVPLHFVWRYVEPQLQGLPVHISQVGGSVWQGHLRLTINDLPELGEVQGRWQLNPLGFLLAKLQLNVELETADLRLALPLSITAKQLVIKQGQGYLDLASLNPILRKQQGSAEGAVELIGLNAQLALQPLAINDIAGRLTYSGGEISLLVENKPVQAAMPPLVGQLERANERALLTAQTLESLVLFEGFVKDDGWGGLAIRRNFIDTLGQEWPMKAEPDDVVFEVSRKVL